MEAPAPGPGAAACMSILMDCLTSDLKEHAKIWLTKRSQKHHQKQGNVTKWMYFCYVLQGLFLRSLINKNEKKIISDWSRG